MISRTTPSGGLALTLSSVLGLACSEEPATEPPWEIWHDLHRLAEIVPGDRVELRSSYCPSGCRFDRHSADEPRYLRRDGDEGVVFEQTGAGAITRIWMTTGTNESHPLPESVRMRVYIDQAPEPVIDAPLPELFDGSRPPFVPPLVGERLTSSGGNYSYVPIPYRRGCRVTLLGADGETLWYQFTHHRLPSPSSVVSFTGREDLDAWARLLGTRGTDPWRPSRHHRMLIGKIELPPQTTILLEEIEGPDSLVALRLDLPKPHWHGTRLRLIFDGRETVRMPVSAFFATGRRSTPSARSLLVGVSDDDRVYSYFPMPFFDKASILLRNTRSSPTTVGYEIRTRGREPAPSSGLFGAHFAFDRETTIGSDIPLLSLVGRGKWVGLFAELASISTRKRDYLEGDERVFVDGSSRPTLHGTGVEDFFNGGFYFDQGPFQLALHGSPYHIQRRRNDTTAAYRLMLTDAVPFSKKIEVGLEGGPNQNRSLRRTTVAYYYLQAN